MHIDSIKGKRLKASLAFVSVLTALSALVLAMRHQGLAEESYTAIKCIGFGFILYLAIVPWRDNLKSINTILACVLLVVFSISSFLFNQFLVKSPQEAFRMAETSKMEALISDYGTNICSMGDYICIEDDKDAFYKLLGIYASVKKHGIDPDGLIIIKPIDSQVTLVSYTAAEAFYLNNKREYNQFVQIMMVIWISLIVLIKQIHGVQNYRVLKKRLRE